MPDTEEEIRELLTHSRTIAIVGLSDKPERDSYEVARYLQQQGYRIVPVNPMVKEVLGETSYPSVEAIPAALAIDIVDIFRKSEDVPPIVEAALSRNPKAVWMQLGVENEAAAQNARTHHRLVVQNRCIMIEHRRLHIPAVPPRR
ncbi:MAG: CoA-binding protein [Thermoplasmata archaeon]|nr:CoA-binding protein [Thermoplasmata archaeon]